MVDIANYLAKLPKDFGLLKKTGRVPFSIFLFEKS